MEVASFEPGKNMVQISSARKTSARTAGDDFYDIFIPATVMMLV